MKRLILVAAAATMALVSTAASAQSYGGYDSYNRSYQRDYDGRNDGYRNQGGFRDHRGYGAERRYQRGSYLPRSYRSSRYAMQDYRRYGYGAPPRGHAYYRTDSGEVALAAIATGLIVSIIAGSNHGDSGYGYNGYGYGYGR